MTERVTFLNDSGVAYSADIDTALLQTLRAGYPMKGWPYPWREIAPHNLSGASQEAVSGS